MRAPTRALILALLVLAPAGVARADWYDDYDAGIKAAQGSNWDQVIAKMNAAIAKTPNENARARTYGNIFIPYHPYYYRGVAYMQKGIPCNSAVALQNLQSAMSDLRNTSGPGKVTFGEPSSLIIRLNEMIVACGVTGAPAPTPAPTQPVPTPPAIDPSLEPAKRRADAALRSALSKLAEAQGAQAQRLASAEFSQASGLLRDANNLNVSASSATDFNRVAETADRASRAFDAAISAARINQGSQPATPAPGPSTPAPSPRPGTTTPPVAPTTPPRTPEVIRPAREQLKQALGDYFEGRFRESAALFQQLSTQYSNNAMIWAFLGASQYYDYYLRGQTDAATLESAKDALRQARRINPNLRLDPQYFSPRFQAFYTSIQ